MASDKNITPVTVTDHLLATVVEEVRALRAECRAVGDLLRDSVLTFTKQQAKSARDNEIRVKGR